MEKFFETLVGKIANKINAKIDKVAGAVAGNIPVLSADGSIYDSGKQPLALPQTSNLIRGNGSGGAVAATPGTDYVVPKNFEPIDEITLTAPAQTVYYTKTPQGKDYDFSDLLVEITFPSAFSPSGSCVYCAGETSRPSIDYKGYLLHYATTFQEHTGLRLKWKIDNAVITGDGYYGQINGFSSVNALYKIGKTLFETMSKINFFRIQYPDGNQMPTGTQIKVWGVWR